MKRKFRKYATILMIIEVGLFSILTSSCYKECCPETDNPVAPTVATDTVIDITQTTAQCGGTVLSDGGDSVTARGVCWGTIPTPTLADSVTTDGSGTGSFSSFIFGLTPGIKYYVRAYATNVVGTSYGDEISFETLTGIPTLTTTIVSDITQITATSGGNILSDGGSTVTVRGVCWSTSSNPAITDAHTSDGTGTGIFVSQITGLSPGTTYLIRAYATNSSGTAYGDQVTCITGDSLSCPGMPTVTHGGQVYRTAQVGTQCWLRENLNIGLRINGTQEQTDNGEIEKYCYDDLEANCDIYGGLYKWAELVQYLNSATDTTSWDPVPAGNITGLCPEGWHIPANTEWGQLYIFLGGGLVAGGEMKETGTAHWISPNADATNSSGFTALPGGVRTNLSTFGGIGYNCFFWSSNDDGISAAGIELYFDNGSVAGNNNWKTYGQSVRCLKD